MYNIQIEMAPADFHLPTANETGHCFTAVLNILLGMAKLFQKIIDVPSPLVLTDSNNWCTCKRGRVLLGVKSLLSTTDHSTQVNGYAFFLQLLLPIAAALKKLPIADVSSVCSVIVSWCFLCRMDLS
jgi:hypothetical protein